MQKEEVTKEMVIKTGKQTVGGRNVVPIAAFFRLVSEFQIGLQRQNAHELSIGFSAGPLPSADDTIGSVRQRIAIFETLSTDNQLTSTPKSDNARELVEVSKHERHSPSREGPSEPHDKLKTVSYKSESDQSDIRETGKLFLFTEIDKTTGHLDGVTKTQSRIYNGYNEAQESMHDAQKYSYESDPIAAQESDYCSKTYEVQKQVPSEHSSTLEIVDMKWMSQENKDKNVTTERQKLVPWEQEQGTDLLNELELIMQSRFHKIAEAKTGKKFEELENKTENEYVRKIEVDLQQTITQEMDAVEEWEIIDEDEINAIAEDYLIKQVEVTGKEIKLKGTVPAIQKIPEIGVTIDSERTTWKMLVPSEDDFLPENDNVTDKTLTLQYTKELTVERLELKKNEFPAESIGKDDPYSRIAKGEEFIATSTAEGSRIDFLRNMTGESEEIVLSFQKEINSDELNFADILLEKPTKKSTPIFCELTETNGERSYDVKSTKGSEMSYKIIALKQSPLSQQEKMKRRESAKKSAEISNEILQAEQLKTEGDVSMTGDNKQEKKLPTTSQIMTVQDTCGSPTEQHFENADDFRETFKGTFQNAFFDENGKPWGTTRRFHHREQQGDSGNRKAGYESPMPEREVEIVSKKEASTAVGERVTDHQWIEMPRQEEMNNMQDAQLERSLKDEKVQFHREDERDKPKMIGIGKRKQFDEMEDEINRATKGHYSPPFTSEGDIDKLKKFQPVQPHIQPSTVTITRMSQLQDNELYSTEAHMLREVGSIKSSTEDREITVQEKVQEDHSELENMETYTEKEMLINQEAGSGRISVPKQAPEVDVEELITRPELWIPPTAEELIGTNQKDRIRSKNFQFKGQENSFAQELVLSDKKECSIPLIITTSTVVPYTRDIDVYSEILKIPRGEKGESETKKETLRMAKETVPEYLLDTDIQVITDHRDKNECKKCEEILKNDEMQDQLETRIPQIKGSSEDIFELTSLKLLSDERSGKTDGLQSYISPGIKVGYSGNEGENMEENPSETSQLTAVVTGAESIKSDMKFSTTLFKEMKNFSDTNEIVKGPSETINIGRLCCDEKVGGRLVEIHKEDEEGGNMKRSCEICVDQSHYDEEFRESILDELEILTKTKELDTFPNKEMDLKVSKMSKEEQEVETKEEHKQTSGCPETAVETEEEWSNKNSEAIEEKHAELVINDDNENYSQVLLDQQFDLGELKFAKVVEDYPRNTEKISKSVPKEAGSLQKLQDFNELVLMGIKDAKGTEEESGVHVEVISLNNKEKHCEDLCELSPLPSYVKGEMKRIPAIYEWMQKEDVRDEEGEWQEVGNLEDTVVKYVNEASSELHVDIEKNADILCKRPDKSMKREVEKCDQAIESDVNEEHEMNENYSQDSEVDTTEERLKGELNSKHNGNEANAIEMLRIQLKECKEKRIYGVEQQQLSENKIALEKNKEGEKKRNSITEVEKKLAGEVEDVVRQLEIGKTSSRIKEIPEASDDRIMIIQREPILNEHMNTLDEKSVSKSSHEYNNLGQKDFGPKEPTTFHHEIFVERESISSLEPMNESQEIDARRIPFVKISSVGESWEQKNMESENNRHETAAAEKVHIELSGSKKRKGTELKPQDGELLGNDSVECEKETNTVRVIAIPVTLEAISAVPYECVPKEQMVADSNLEDKLHRMENPELIYKTEPKESEILASELEAEAKKQKPFDCIVLGRELIKEYDTIIPEESVTKKEHIKMKGWTESEEVSNLLDRTEELESETKSLDDIMNTGEVLEGYGPVISEEPTVEGESVTDVKALAEVVVDQLNRTEDLEDTQSKTFEDIIPDSDLVVCGTVTSREPVVGKEYVTDALAEMEVVDELNRTEYLEDTASRLLEDMVSVGGVLVKCGTIVSEESVEEGKHVSGKTPAESEEVISKLYKTEDLEEAERGIAAAPIVLAKLGVSKAYDNVVESSLDRDLQMVRETSPVNEEDQLKHMLLGSEDVNDEKTSMQRGDSIERNAHLELLSGDDVLIKEPQGTLSVEEPTIEFLTRKYAEHTLVEGEKKSPDKTTFEHEILEPQGEIQHQLFTKKMRDLKKFEVKLSEKRVSKGIKSEKAEFKRVMPQKFVEEKGVVKEHVTMEDGKQDQFGCAEEIINRQITKNLLTDAAGFWNDEAEFAREASNDIDYVEEGARGSETFLSLPDIQSRLEEAQLSLLQRTVELAPAKGKEECIDKGSFLTDVLISSEVSFADLVVGEQRHETGDMTGTEAEQSRTEDRDLQKIGKSISLLTMECLVTKEKEIMELSKEEITSQTPIKQPHDTGYLQLTPPTVTEQRDEASVMQEVMAEEYHKKETDYYVTKNLNKPVQNDDEKLDSMEIVECFAAETCLDGEGFIASDESEPKLSVMKAQNKRSYPAMDIPFPADRNDIFISSDVEMKVTSGNDYKDEVFAESLRECIQTDVKEERAKDDETQRMVASNEEVEEGVTGWVELGESKRMHFDEVMLEDQTHELDSDGICYRHLRVNDKMKTFSTEAEYPFEVTVDTLLTHEDKECINMETGLEKQDSSHTDQVTVCRNDDTINFAMREVIGSVAEEKEELSVKASDESSPKFAPRKWEKTVEGPEITSETLQTSESTGDIKYGKELEEQHTIKVPKVYKEQTESSPTEYSEPRIKPFETSVEKSTTPQKCLGVGKKSEKEFVIQGQQISELTRDGKPEKSVDEVSLEVLGRDQRESEKKLITVEGNQEFIEKAQVVQNYELKMFSDGDITISQQPFLVSANDDKTVLVKESSEQLTAKHDLMASFEEDKLGGYNRSMMTALSSYEPSIEEERNTASKALLDTIEICSTTLRQSESIQILEGRSAGQQSAEFLFEGENEKVQKEGKSLSCSEEYDTFSVTQKGKESFKDPFIPTKGIKTEVAVSPTSRTSAAFGSIGIVQESEDQKSFTSSASFDASDINTEKRKDEKLFYCEEESGRHISSVESFMEPTNAEVIYDELNDVISKEVGKNEGRTISGKQLDSALKEERTAEVESEKNLALSNVLDRYPAEEECHKFILSRNKEAEEDHFFPSFSSVFPIHAETETPREIERTDLSEITAPVSEQMKDKFSCRTKEYQGIKEDLCEVESVRDDKRKLETMAEPASELASAQSPILGEEPSLRQKIDKKSSEMDEKAEIIRDIHPEPGAEHLIGESVGVDQTSSCSSSYETDFSTGKRGDSKSLTSEEIATIGKIASQHGHEESDLKEKLETYGGETDKLKERIRTCSLLNEEKRNEKRLNIQITEVIDDIMKPVVNLSGESTYKTKTMVGSRDGYETCVTPQEDTFETALGYHSQESEYTTATSEVLSEDHGESATPTAIRAPVQSARLFVPSEGREQEPNKQESAVIDSRHSSSDMPDMELVSIQDGDSMEEDTLPTTPSGALLASDGDPRRPISPVPPGYSDGSVASGSFIKADQSRRQEEITVLDSTVEAPRDEVLADEWSWKREVSDAAIFEESLHVKAMDFGKECFSQYSNLFMENKTSAVHIIEKDEDITLPSEAVSCTESASLDPLDKLSIKSESSGKKYSTSRRSSSSSQKSSHDERQAFAEQLTQEFKMSWAEKDEEVQSAKQPSLSSDEYPTFLPENEQVNAIEVELETVDEEPEEVDSLNGRSVSSNGQGTDISVTVGKYKTVSSDNVSETSLQEFERIERDVLNKGESSLSGSEVELYVSGKLKAADGSTSSLAEFERLEQEVVADGSPQDEVMVLSDIREESEVEEMSVRDGDEEHDSIADIKVVPVEEDTLLATPLASPTDSIERNFENFVPEAMGTSIDSLEISIPPVCPQSDLDGENYLTNYEVIEEVYEDMHDSLEIIPQDKDSVQGEASIREINRDSQAVFSGDTYQEDQGEKDSLEGDMDSLLHDYPTTLTTFETIQIKEDGSTEIISRKVLTRVTDPVISHVQFTGTENEDRLRDLEREEEFETVDIEGNVTRTTLHRNAPSSSGGTSHATHRG